MKTIISLREISVSAEYGQFQLDEMHELHEILKSRGGNGLSFTYYKGDYCRILSDAIVNSDGQTDYNYRNYVSNDELSSDSEESQEV